MTVITTTDPSNNISYLDDTIDLDELEDLDDLNRLLQQVLITNGVLKTKKHRNCNKFRYLPLKRSLGDLFRRKFDCLDKTSCPVCRQKIISKHKKKIYDLTIDFEERILLNTFTISHEKRNTLPYLYKKLKSSIRDLKNSHGWRQLQKDLDHQFHFDRIEIKVSPKTGYHPHLHQVYGCKNQDIPRDEINTRILDMWSSSLELNGLRKPSKEHGTDVKEGKSLVQYPLKQEHSDEILPEVREQLKKMKQRTKRRLSNTDDVIVGYSIGQMEREVLYYQEIPKYKNDDFSKEEVVKHLSQIQKTFYGDYYCRVYQ